MTRHNQGWATEMQGPGGDTDWARNGIVWPDEDSAKQAGFDLLMRCTHFGDYRAISVNEEPNRPTWATFIDEVAARSERIRSRIATVWP